MSFKKHAAMVLCILLTITVIYGCSNQTEPSILELENPSAEGSELPFLYTDDSGTVFLSWVEPVSSDGMYRHVYATLGEDKWSEPMRIASSSSWFINWADYPSVIARSGEIMAAHQLMKVPGNTYSYNVNLIQKKSSGWDTPFTPHFDSTATEHGFVSMAPLDENQFMAVWLDGRRTDDRSDEEYFDLSKAMTLRSAIIDSSGSVAYSKLIDQDVCDCCQTSLTVTADGPIAAYRNRTDEEIRDIYISKYKNDSWSEPKPVHNDGWKIGACPVNGPKIVSKDSLVAVSWYTGAGDKPTVKTALSQDYGETFGEPITISSKETQGRVDAVIAGSESVYVSEISKEGENYYLTLHHLSIDKGVINSRLIAEMNGSRKSGFPQMEIVNNTLVFAWTEITDENSTKIATALVRL